MIAPDITREPATRFDDARRAMIDSQLRTSGVNDAFVLARMSVVPREDFVPEGQRAAAYTDRAVRLPDGGALPAPLFHGLLLAEARPDRADRVVVIDGGSGYLPALLEPMVGALTVVSPEDAAAGKIGARPTLVLIDGAIEHLPEPLVRKLEEGTRVVTGLVERGVTRLAVGRKAGGALGLVALVETGVPRLAAFDREAGWRF
ncbi:MAG: protein-L-isoaspartate O-methyltransferase [Altererythrobacter sp.]|nr:protein-L-isoaspartate O-methyltransferase [Altererythrobacter sp.]